MNEIVKNLSLNSSYFANPHGLKNKFNKSTAFDIALASKEAVDNPMIAKIVSTPIYFT